MVKVTHIVGWQGTGKSTLANIIVADMRSRGVSCAVVDSEAMRCDYKSDAAKAAAAHADVQFLVLEHMPDAFTGGRAGDKVIFLIEPGINPDLDGAAIAYLSDAVRNHVTHQAPQKAAA